MFYSYRTIKDRLDRQPRAENSRLRVLTLDLQPGDYAWDARDNGGNYAGPGTAVYTLYPSWDIYGQFTPADRQENP